MRRSITFKLLYGLIGLLIIGHNSSAQFIEENTVGLLLNSPSAYEGYTFFTPISQKATYLINNEGKLLHSWEGISIPGHTIYLNEDGTLYKAVLVEDDPIKRHIVAGGAGGRIERYDWDSQLIWEYEYADLTKRHHHDFQVLPNGNVLVLAWEVKSKEEAIQAGRDPATLAGDELWPDHIVEVKPLGATGGEIVWEWHVWDHLIQDFDPTKDHFGVVGDHPELIDLNYKKSTGSDWNHINSINYNPDLDQILLSVWAFDELWIIDHSTTTAESSSHAGGNYGSGGDLLFRWGNPMVYRKGVLEDKKFFQQHNAHWVPSGLPNAGKIMLFNNGTNRSEEIYSSIDIITPAIDVNGKYIMNNSGTFEPKRVDYSYTTPVKTDFLSNRFSSAQQLPNGNILICKGPQGEFFEIDPSEEIVWNYINPITPDGPLFQGDIAVTLNSVFRVLKYDTDYPAFLGRSLSPQGNLELEEVVDVVSALDKGDLGYQKSKIYPNPVKYRLHLSGMENKKDPISIYTLQGERLMIFKEYDAAGIDVSELPNGIYIISLNDKYLDKFIIAR